MRKVGIAAVCAFLVFGFYRASLLVDTDITATSPSNNLASLKDRVTHNISNKVSDIEDKKDSVMQETKDDIKEDVLNLSVADVLDTGSPVINTVLGDGYTESLLSSTVDWSEYEAELDSDGESEGLSLSNGSDDEIRKEIIKIYKESPEVFNEELIREILKDYDIEDTDVIEAMCREYVN